MSERRFDILFDGSVINGHDVSLVKNNVQTLFKLSDEQVDKIFCGRPVAIKRGLDRKSAQKYQTALTKAGAKIQLVLHQLDQAASAPTTAKGETAGEPAEKPAMATNAAELDTLPAGSPLLHPQERANPAQRDVDVSHLELEKPNPFLTGHDDPESELPAAPLISGEFDLAEPGVLLGVPGEIEVMELPDIESWTLAEIGSLLGQMQTPQPAEVAISSELALVQQQGYLLEEQERSIQEAVEVDTSGLELIDGAP